eukprot:Rmarinus@m.11266
MSRHRHIRNIEYEDDYGADDLGTSPSDSDYLATSPNTAAQYLYRRDNDEPADSAFDQAWQDNNYNQQLEVAIEQLQDRMGVFAEEHTDDALAEALEACDLNVDDAVSYLMGEDEALLGKKKRPKGAKQGKGNALKKKIETSDVDGRGEKSGETTVGTFPASAAVSTTPAKTSPKSPFVHGGLAISTTAKVGKGDAGPKRSPKASPKGSPKGTPPLSPREPGEETRKTAGGATMPSNPPLTAEHKTPHGLPAVNLVVLGHVDAGKSTLMGQVLFQVGEVTQRQMHKYEHESKQQGKASFAYAWVLDEQESERVHGVTIDVGVTEFETPRRRVALLDAPGHRDFIPNMISGAAQADCAILVVNATVNEFEAGFHADGQTKEHALLARALGVSQVVVAINKLDTVDWSQERYNQIVNEVEPFLRQSGFREKNIRFIPCSGLTGENIRERTSESLNAWYDGQSLLEMIDTFDPIVPQLEAPLRFMIHDVFRSTGIGQTISGKVESGVLRARDYLLVMPLNEVCQVKCIESQSERVSFLQSGCRADVGVEFLNSSIDISKISSGSVACDPQHPTKAVKKFVARLITFQLDRPITNGYQADLYSHNCHEAAVVRKIVGLANKSTGEITQKARCLISHVSGVVQIKLNRPVCLESYSDFKALGRVTLRESGKTIAAGVVTEILS